MFALRRPFRRKNKSILYAPRVLLVKVGCTLSVDKSFTLLRERRALRLARRLTDRSDV
jgi:hypothetical protein